MAFLKKPLFATALAALALVWLAGAAAAAQATPEPSTWFIDQARFKLGAHGTLKCEACHQAEMRGILPGASPRHPDPSSPGYLVSSALRNYDYAACGQCHRLALGRVLKGAHAQARARREKTPPAPGQFPAPVCGDCHNAHYDRAHLDRLASGRRLYRVCATCHPDQARTYLQNFHGQQAVILGNSKAAFCTDCHGAHTVRSLKKPEQALAACRRCHPQAQARFAQMVIHPTTRGLDKDDAALVKRVNLIQALAWIMGVVALITVGFFYGHNFVWLLRELHYKIRRRGHGD